MFDDDLYNYYTGTSTETEQEQPQAQVSYGQNQTDTASSYNPYTSTSSYDSDYDDDYSVTPNYTEQKSYESNSTTSLESNNDVEEVKRYRKMNMPVITKQEETVTVTKTTQKIQLQPRMKIAISMFAIIMFSLVFVIIWNFVSVNKLNATIADKQVVINELSANINGLETEYTLLGDEEQLRELAQNAGFVEANESNTFYADSGEFFVEQPVKDLPSNWFNDVCDFFSHLFR